MAINRDSSQHHKAPTQNPVDFYKGKVHGGPHGTPTKVPERLTGGPMREKLSKPGL